MPFELNETPPRRIAVIGAGISGMGAAYLLADDNDVVVFEAAPRLGGHARTIMAGKRGDQPVDTGFIVFNYTNYPHLTALFDRLDVPVAKSKMSFGASFDGGRCEYQLENIDTLFAARRNAVNPKFLRMVRDIVHFNKAAPKAATDPAMTVRDLLDALGTGTWFRDRYLLPFSGAIWSMPTEKVLDFPAAAMVRFFENHALMSHEGQHQWYTVQGGSVEYVRRLETHLRNVGVDLRRATPVNAVRRVDRGVEVKAKGGEWEFFDDVVFATHSDVTLSLLADANDTERAALGAVRYQTNEAVLHCDTSFMPARRKCWASWVYKETCAADRERISLSYWMNSLQPIPMDDLHFVTLNSNRPVREECIYDATTFHHPVYDVAALAAQKTIAAINGTANTWFCGAWMRNGFHEDGFASAVDVADAMRRAQPRVVAA